MKEKLSSVDLGFWLKMSFVIFVGLSIVNDVPEVDRSASIPEPVNGQCRSLDFGVVCFNTWKVLGFNTGLVTGVYDFSENGAEKDLSKFIFVRESDFIEGKEWSESSRLRSGNYSGGLPDYNVSVIGLE